MEKIKQFLKQIWETCKTHQTKTYIIVIVLVLTTLGTVLKTNRYKHTLRNGEALRIDLNAKLEQANKNALPSLIERLQAHIQDNASFIEKKEREMSTIQQELFNAKEKQTCLLESLEPVATGKMENITCITE